MLTEVEWLVLRPSGFTQEEINPLPFGNHIEWPMGSVWKPHFGWHLIKQQKVLPSLWNVDFSWKFNLKSTAHCGVEKSLKPVGNNIPTFRSQVTQAIFYEGWNFNSGNYLCTTDTK